MNYDVSNCHTMLQFKTAFLKQGFSIPVFIF